MKAYSFNKALGIVLILMAVSVSGIAQNPTNPGTSKSDKGAAKVGGTENAAERSTVIISASMIQGFAWHSTESRETFDARLASNLSLLRAMDGVLSADYEMDKNEIRMEFAKQAPSPESIVKSVTPKIKLSAYDQSQKH